MVFQFDLNCENSFRGDILKALYQIGNLIGAIAFGILADK